MGNCKIVGICQVHNEDVFLGQVIANIAAFCDEIIIANHKSRDRTAEIANEHVRQNSRISIRRIKHASEAHEIVRKYANTPTWIFPVDGDELYDPVGLAKLRTQILRGDHDRYRQIYGHSMHCAELDRIGRIAKGYISPPSRTVTKLYNFNAIFDWAGPCSEKCLGGKILFKPGYSEQSNLNLMDTMSWDESPFRLLHTCFLRRSSLEPDLGSSGRLNPYELHSTSRLLRCVRRLKQHLGMAVKPNYKQERYMRGSLEQKNIESFLNRS